MNPLERLKSLGRAVIELRHRRRGGLGRVYAAEVVDRGIRIGVVFGDRESSIVLDPDNAQRLGVWLQEHAR